MNVPKTYEQQHYARIGEECKTDKGGLAHTFAGYSYLDHYARFFEPLAALKDGRLSILEIGVLGGNSLRMWEQLFPRASIVGLDVDTTGGYGKLRPTTTVIRGSQTDVGLLTGLCRDNKFDIVVDDGSHAYGDIVTSAIAILPLMNPHGFYCIEDICVGWPLPTWPGMSATNYGPNNMRVLREFINAMQMNIMLRSGPVLAVHFFHGLLMMETLDEQWKPA